jgi:hypothetical protein
VCIGSIAAIGKESNSLEEMDAGLIHDARNVHSEYSDRRRDYWSTIVVPALKALPPKVWERESGKPRRILIDARLGRRRPHRRKQELLISVTRKHSLL